ncbi:Uncharacterized protein APZ42_032279 [Daphnia magna]|uniref:CxC3 like cysteine cluster domain-containing protein n=1 Tax=Daphnia magna TaxID=35525 RepID=A0A164M4B2_9CRUS|nr:Uncharacterized protein APZ42_032279 [Daphnia magna]
MVFKPELLYYLIVFSEIIEKNVTVPGFCPENCSKCEALSTLMPKIGCKTIAVVTTEGRFNITSAAFGCKSCSCIFEAKAEDYIESGFWPASPDEDSFYLFCRDFLRQWFHLQHKSASISRAAYIGAALEASNEHHRISIFFTHGGKSLFEGVAFATDEKVAAFTAEINQHIPQVLPLWSGHLMDHAAATLGEEQEQTFSKMSRYCSSTKRMSKAHRIDHLSKEILYKNFRKEKKMVSTLIQRLKTADIKELSQHLAIDSSHQELLIIVKKIYILI